MVLMEHKVPVNDVQILVVSRDQMIREFLRRFLAFQGFQKSKDVGLHQVVARTSRVIGKSLVLLDLSVLKEEAEEQVQVCMNQLMKANVPIIVLVECDWGLYASDFIPVGVKGVLRKPIDCQQIENLLTEAFV